MDAALRSSTSEPPIKTLGRRRPSRGGLERTAPFLEMVVGLRGNRPFLPKGVHRFESFEESQAWSIRMMARQPSLARRS